VPCYYPLKGYFSQDVNPSGKRSIVFNYRQGYGDLLVSLPCGRCIGCRLELSRQWAIRAVHEALMHEESCFITLTYSESKLPSDRSLDVRAWQLFMKKLRKQYGNGIRFLHCGEYGEDQERPHYHALLFNHDFQDKVHWKTSEGEKLYRSTELEKLWSNGFCSVGSVTFQSAAYVARYCMKKVTGDKAEAHYQGRRSEYLTSSCQPRGLGSTWLEAFSSDAYPRDYILLNGAKLRPPRYYDEELQRTNPRLYAKVRENRVLRDRDPYESSQYRMTIKEQVQTQRINRLVRTLEG